jgi:hypothetical protein
MTGLIVLALLVFTCVFCVGAARARRRYLDEMEARFFGADLTRCALVLYGVKRRWYDSDERLRKRCLEVVQNVDGRARSRFKRLRWGIVRDTGKP